MRSNASGRPRRIPPNRPTIGRFWKRRSSREFLGKEWRKIGDVEAGLKTGTLVEAEYRAPYVAHQPLEPLNGIAIVYRRRDGDLGRPSEPSIRAVHRGGCDRPQAGTGDLPQSMVRWKLRSPSRVRERPRPGRDRQPDARERRSSSSSRARRIFCRTFRGRLRSPDTEAASTRGRSSRPTCNWHRRLR